jgi:endoglucanase
MSKPPDVTFTAASTNARQAPVASPTRRGGTSRRRLLQWAAVPATGVLLRKPALAKRESPKLFQRGVAIHNMMNWARVEPSDPRRYAWPPFSGAAYETSDLLLRNVASAGFDFVRLTVDPGPFLQFSGKHRDALDAHLVQVVRRLLGHGFGVIVDFHPNTHVPDYAPVELVQALEAPLFVDYVGLMRRTASLLASLGSDKIALELMNEPQYGWDPATTVRWQRMLEQLHAAARAAAPELLVVLTGARGGDAKGLIAIDPAPFAGSNVLFSFHYYELHDFTHQGVKSSQPGASHWQFLSGLPYPAASGNPNRVWSRIKENVLSDQSLAAADKPRVLQQVRQRVADYFATGFDRSRIAADFDQIKDWAQRHGIDPRAVILGEFGVTRTYGMYRASDAGAQEAWMRDVRSEAETRGFRWALWALSGYGGMALVATDGSNELDRVSLRALGLNTGY